MLCRTDWSRNDNILHHEDTQRHVKMLRLRQAALDSLQHESGHAIDDRALDDLPLIDLDADLEDAPPSLGDDCSAWNPKSTLHGPALPTDPSGSIYDDFSGAFAASTDDREDDDMDNALEEHDFGREAPQAAKPLYEPRSPQSSALSMEGTVPLSPVVSVVRNSSQTPLRRPSGLGT
jgi:hypothetical protein